jgi:hypothetical protein
MFTGALLSMALAGASFALKAAPASTGATIVNTPFVGTVYNCFNGRPVTFSGVLHATIHETLTPSGDLISVQNLNWADVKGTDVSGNSYVANSYVAHETANSTQHLPALGAVVITGGGAALFPLSFEMVSKGSAPNFRVHSLYHVTVTPDGSLTSYVDTITITSCP